MSNLNARRANEIHRSTQLTDCSPCSPAPSSRFPSRAGPFLVRRWRQWSDRSTESVSACSWYFLRSFTIAGSSSAASLQRRTLEMIHLTVCVYWSLGLRIDGLCIGPGRFISSGENYSEPGYRKPTIELYADKWKNVTRRWLNHRQNRRHFTNDKMIFKRQIIHFISYFGIHLK